MPKNTNSATRPVALCGVLCAFSVALLLVGSALQIGTYAAPMLAAFALVPVREEYGTRYALLLWAATAVLTLLLVPDKELAFFYALVLGPYPALRGALARLHPAPLRWAARLAWFDLTLAAMYALLLTLLAGPALQAELAGYTAGFVAALVGLGNLCFVLMDVALGRFTRLYRTRLRRHIQRYL